ncbi:DUF5693 family protein [Oceanobacillus damuensis]|uniref:DUF5693 family protein n=1 Tax=Oceanobacillus damuensis TaxID=937928 RepID=UPI000AE5BDCD|nr:DUF5693 family protein [Oceanobacillus damuensis]
MKKWIWGVLLLLLVLSAPGIIERWNIEEKNVTYELIVPFEQIYTMTDEEDMTLDKALSALKEAGMTSVSLEPTSLNDMEKQGIVSIFSDSQLEDTLLFSEFLDDFNPELSGHYVTEPENPYYQEMIKEFFNPAEIMIGDIPFYFIEENDEFNHYTDFAYDELAIEKINEHGLAHLMRVENDESDLVDQRITDQLIDLKDENTAVLLSSGTEIIGFDEETPNNQSPSMLSEAGYRFYSIEFNPIKGLARVAQNTDYNLIRLHSIDITRENLELDESIARTIRAVKERNIRSVFFHMPEVGESAEENLEAATSYLAGVQEQMPDHFKAGIPDPFDQISIPVWVTAVVLLAAIIFTYLAASVTRNPKLQLAAALFMVLLAGAYVLLDRIVLLQAFALIIAVITPIYAVLSSASGSTKLGEITLSYLKAVGISIIGIIIVIGLLNGNGFITGVQGFRGVIMVYIVPIVFVSLVVLWTISKNLLQSAQMKNALAQTVKLLQFEVRYWHLLVFAAIAGIGMFYIGRTGNFGMAFDLELIFRQWLEETLYVRPRTKEFLIGFPFFILALYVMGIDKKWGSILLIPGVIGFLSIMNTFTHFHIPLSISLLRTIYSVILGYLIGLLFIFIVKKGYQFISKRISRWT